MHDEEPDREHDREAYERHVHLAACRERCRIEWSNVNDPPCHPRDDGWAPCCLCIGTPP